MQDRVPAPGKENRVRIRTDDGQTIEGIFEYADDASVQGSAYNKANVLPDAIAMALSIDPVSSEIKDAFYALLRDMDTSKDLVIIEVLDQNESPVPGCIFSTDDGMKVTDSAGHILLKYDTSLSPKQETLTYKLPLDKGGTSGTVQFTPVAGTPLVVPVSVTTQSISSPIAITKSGTYALSRAGKVNVTLLSGGGGAYSFDSPNIPSGCATALAAGGGFIDSEAFSVTLTQGETFTVTIGAAGQGGKWYYDKVSRGATEGGMTSFSGGGVSHSTEFGEIGGEPDVSTAGSPGNWTDQVSVNAGKPNSATIRVKYNGYQSSNTVEKSLGANAISTVNGITYAHGGSVVASGGPTQNQYDNETNNAKKVSYRGGNATIKDDDTSKTSGTAGVVIVSW